MLEDGCVTREQWIIIMMQDDRAWLLPTELLGTSVQWKENDLLFLKCETLFKSTYQMIVIDNKRKRIQTCFVALGYRWNVPEEETSSSICVAWRWDYLRIELILGLTSKLCSFDSIVVRVGWRRASGVCQEIIPWLSLFQMDNHTRCGYYLTLLQLLHCLAVCWCRFIIWLM